MDDASNIEERLRRLEERHEALAIRVAVLDSEKGAIMMKKRASDAEWPGLLTTLAVILFIALMVFFAVHRALS